MGFIPLKIKIVNFINHIKRGKGNIKLSIMKLKNLIKKLFESNPRVDQEVFIELWEETEDGYKSLKIPIIDVEVNSDHGVGLEPQPVYSVEDLVFTGMVKKAFIHKWEKRKYYPVNAPSGMESYFPIKKKIKLTLPKETEK